MDAEGSKRAEYKAAYYRANREKMRAQCRAWDAQNHEKQSGYQKKYKDKNREKLAEKSRIRYAQNPDKERAEGRAYYAKNAEERRAYRRAYRAANLDRERERDRLSKQATKERDQPRRRAYHEANKDKLNAATKAFRKAHPEVISFHAHKRRATLKGATIGNPQVIIAWESRWRNAPAVRCYWCQGIFPGNECVLDHVIAFKHGGWHEIGNVCTSCDPCNNKKSARTLAAWNKLIKEPVLF